MKKIVLIFLSIIPFTVYGQIERKSIQITTQYNYNLPGKDYKVIELPTAEFKQCENLCLEDSNCKAYTYVKPGVQGTKARCWLKSEVPNGRNDENCISGVKLNLQPSDYSNADKITQQPIQIAEIKKYEPIPLPVPNKNEAEFNPIPLPNPNDKKVESVINNSRLMVKAIPINLPYPKPQLAKTRAESLQEAFNIPELNKQLVEITNSQGLFLSNLISTSVQGNEAKSNIIEGRSGIDMSNIEPASKLVDLSDFDWSGGIQLTPNAPASEIVWNIEGSMYVPIASINIRGIEVSNELSIKDMYDSNTVKLVNGEIIVSLYPPNKFLEPYLITIDIDRNFLNSSYMLSSTLLVTETAYRPDGYKEAEVTFYLNAEKNKYVGQLNLAQSIGFYSDVIIIKLNGLAFSGITITQL